ncbi:hypothetical protein [Streptomyces luteogriseus]|uniref:hypothetical protein n=1 Tax=Streptomyces luteogriseus TaxID=68233 RepID=UPI0026273C53|nr:hypothetical protein [Streptomyces luteogriseus]WTJ29722.1 hypothetical protein OID52_23075 [Streptomyces luteogriseus]
MSTSTRRFGLAIAVTASLLVGWGAGQGGMSAAGFTNEKSAGTSSTSVPAPGLAPVAAKAAASSSKTIKRDCGFLKSGKYDFYVSGTYAETHRWDNGKCDGHAWVKIKYKDRSGKIRYSSWKSDPETAKTTQADRDHGTILKSYHKGCSSCKEYTLTP